ncbi:MAG: rhodanese-like domain-containing protein [Pseudomonadota bacterium]
MYEELTPTQTAAKLVDGSIQLLDVREGWELDIVSLPQAVHIPLGQLADRLNELNPAAPVAALCHGGVRSAQAAMLLNVNGFTSIYNVTGGIDRWSAEVDPSLPRY